MQKLMKIMIVDDDLMIIRFLREILESNYELEVAETGEEALEKLDQFQPEIILLDVMMPGIDGYETCRRLRQKNNKQDVKVLFLSARTTLSERLKGYQAGGDDYITKPFEMEELLAKIDVFSKLWHEETVNLPTEQQFSQKNLEILYYIQYHVSDIIYIQSKSPYCEFVVESRKQKMERKRIPIQIIEDFFDEKKLVRVHRSYLVNPQKINAFEKLINHEYKILLSDRDNQIYTLPVGRTYHEKLKHLIPSLF